MHESEVLGLILIWNSLLFSVTPFAILLPYTLPSCHKICLIASLWNWHSIAFLFLFSLWWHTKCLFLPLALTLLHDFFFLIKANGSGGSILEMNCYHLQYFRSLCFDKPVERKSSFSLPYFSLLCSNFAAPRNPEVPVQWRYENNNKCL